MINQKELREGNLGYSKFWNKVMTWGPEEGGHPHYGFRCPDDGIILCGSADDIDPIPITQEWLERLWFEKEYDYYVLDGGVSNATIICELVHGEWIAAYQLYRGMNDYMPHIKYVHRLQNLVFDLTGEELKLKPI